MSKKGGSQTATTTTTPDPMAADWMRKVFGAAEGVGQGAGTSAARNFYGGMLPGANLGFGALSGDAAATQQLMNPFMGQVMDRMKSEFGNLNAMTTKGMDDAATKAGAFGGSRHGIATGTALARNAETAQNQMAATLHGGFNDAMGRAGQLVNFGMGGAQGMAGLDPNTMRFQAMQAAGQGMPWGGTTSMTQPVNRNRGAGVLGGAATGAQIGSMIPGLGTGIGAGIGGLLGLFG